MGKLGFGLGECVRVCEVIEASCNFAGEFEVRELVFPYWDDVRFEEEDVGGLEDGIT